MEVKSGVNVITRYSERLFQWFRQLVKLSWLRTKSLVGGLIWYKVYKRKCLDRQWQIKKEKYIGIYLVVLEGDKIIILLAIVFPLVLLMIFIITFTISASMVSFQWCFGLPLFLFPPTCICVTFFIFASSSLRLTCPNHSNLLFLITSCIAITFACFLMSTFVWCSSRLIPKQYLNVEQ